MHLMESEQRVMEQGQHTVSSNISNEETQVEETAGTCIRRLVRVKLFHSVQKNNTNALHIGVPTVRTQELRLEKRQPSRYLAIYGFPGVKYAVSGRSAARG